MAMHTVVGEGGPAAPVMPAVAAVPSVHIWDNDSDDVDGKASVPHRRCRPMRTDAPTSPGRGMLPKWALVAAPAAVVLHNSSSKKASKCRKWSLAIPTMDAEVGMF